MPLPIYMPLAAALLAAAFVVFRVIVRRDYERNGRLTWLSSALETSVFFAWGFFTWADLPRGWPPADLGPVIRQLAWLFIIIGFVGLIATITWFGWLRAFGRRLDKLRQSGPYGWSRNPQVVVCALAVVGYAMLWPSWHTLGWLILYAVPAHLMVLTEEEHLTRVFGEEYVHYCARVPRYLGWVRAPA